MKNSPRQDCLQYWRNGSHYVKKGNYCKVKYSGNKSYIPITINDFNQFRDGSKG